MHEIKHSSYQAFSPIDQILKYTFQTVNSILNPTVDTSTLAH